MEKRTIAQVAIEVLKEAKRPLSIDEIMQVILNKNLYSFNTKDVRAIIRRAIDRRSEGYERKDSVFPKYFEKLPDKKYKLLDES